MPVPVLPAPRGSPAHSHPWDALWGTLKPGDYATRALELTKNKRTTASTMGTARPPRIQGRHLLVARRAARPLWTRRPLGAGGPNHRFAGRRGSDGSEGTEKSERGQLLLPPALCILARGRVGSYCQRLGDLAGPPSTSHCADPGYIHSTVLTA